VLLDLGGLTPTSRGVRVQYSGSKRTVIDGPFPETKELIAGYLLLGVKTLAEAVEWAKGLGPSKIARFGDDILAVVRRHAAGVATAGDA